jgi:hypothetical protein
MSAPGRPPCPAPRADCLTHTTLTPAARHVPGRHGQTGLPLAAAGGSSHTWRSPVALGDVGVFALAVLPLSGGLRIAAWTAALAGFGTFPRRRRR